MAPIPIYPATIRTATKALVRREGVARHLVRDGFLRDIDDQTVALGASVAIKHRLDMEPQKKFAELLPNILRFHQVSIPARPRRQLVIACEQDPFLGKRPRQKRRILAVSVVKNIAAQKTKPSGKTPEHHIRNESAIRAFHQKAYIRERCQSLFGGASSRLIIWYP